VIRRIKKGKKWVLQIFITHFIFLLFFLTLSGQSIQAENISQPRVRTGGDLIVRVPNDLYSLDSQLAITAVEKLVIRNVQEGLLDYDPNGQIVPILAASLPQPIAGEKNKWTIPLKRGIFFHNGSELEANDLVFTFQRLKNSPSPIPARKIFERLISLEAIDRYRVELTTDGLCPNLCDLLTRTELFPLSAKAVQKYAHNYGKVILIGTGPFRFQSRIRNKQITLIKNWQYRVLPLPYLNSISFKFAHKSFPLVKSLRSLRAHVAFQITPEEARILEKNRWIRLYHCAGQQLVQIYLNTDVPPFNKKSIRLALAHGINKVGLMENIFKGFATPADSCIPPWSWAHQTGEDGEEPIEYNTQKAQVILKMEGYDFENPLQIFLFINKEPIFLEMAQCIKDSFAEIPISIEIISLPKAELFDYIYGRNGKIRGDFQAALENWEDLRYGRDPRQFTAELYASSSIYNKVRLSDMVLDNIFEEINYSENFLAQKELYCMAGKRIINSVSTIYLCFPHNIHTARSRVKNLRVNCLNEISFKDVWLLK